jgi:cell division protein FtsB
VKRYTFIAFLLVLIGLQYPIWFGNGSLIAVWRLNSEIAEQKVENAKLQERNLASQAEVADLKSGMDAVEGRARAELGMTRRGETFVHVVEARPRAPGAAPEPLAPPVKP